MLILIAVAIAVLFLLPKKGQKFPGIQSLPQRDADRKEALDLIEAKLVEADKQTRFNDAVSVISGLAEVKKPVK